MRSSSERTIERRLTPQPQGNDADQKTEEEELEEEGKEEEEDRFSPSSSCALPPSIRWENVSTLASCSADYSSEGGDLSSVDRKVEENQESPAAHPVKEGKVDSSKGCRAAAEGGGAGAVAIGGVEGGANEVVLGGEGGGLNERCKNILRSATASSG